MSYHNSFIEELGIKVHSSWTGDKKVKCPFCQDERSRKNQSDRPLSINVDTGAYKCHHCHRKGAVGRKTKYERPNKEYTELSDEVIQWLEDRQLSVDAATLAKVGSTKANGRDLIIFNYYDQHGNLVNAKMRDINDKKFMRQKAGAKGTPFNAQILPNAPYVIIVEGEPDCLAWSTAGYHYVITGNNGSSDDKWVDLVYEELETIEKIYIGVDDDEAGRKYQKLLARRFDKDKLYLIKYHGYKDANEVLEQNGKETGKEILRDCFEAAEPWPVEGITRVQDHMESAYRYFTEGFPNTYRTGVASLDKYWTLYEEDVTVITGAPGAGKSEFVDWLSVRHAMVNGLKAAFFSGEKTEANHLPRLCYKYIGKSRDVMNPNSDVDQQEFMQALAFMHDHIFYMNRLENKLERILEKAKYLVKRHGINILAIDNHSVLDNDPGEKNMRTYIADQISAMTAFAKTCKVHIFIVAHPRKLTKNNQGFYDLPQLYDISESAHWNNLVDNGIALRRNDGYVDIGIRKVRHQDFVGKVGVTKLSYDSISGGQYMDLGVGQFDSEVDEFASYAEELDAPF